MKQRIFRSLLQNKLINEQRRLNPAYGSSELFHGTVLSSLSSLSASQTLPGQSNGNNDTNVLSNYPKRWILEHPVANASDALQMLDELSSYFSSSNNSCDNNLRNKYHYNRFPDLIVFQNTFSVPSSGDNSHALLFLREILPLSAQFLETYPEISKQYGRLNAHKRPLDNHVVGICHYFMNYNSNTDPNDINNISELAKLLDIYLPTRLALNCSTTTTTPNDNCNNPSSSTVISYNEIELETVVQNTDLLYYDNDNNMNMNNTSTMTTSRTARSFSSTNIMEEVWKAQYEDGCKETYVISRSRNTNTNYYDDLNFLKQQYADLLSCDGPQK